MRILSTLLFSAVGIICHAHRKEWENERNCGISFADRIIGGKLAAKGKYPWLVRVGYRKGLIKRFSLLCGGSLISKNFVLTAAHCFLDGTDNIVVHLGETEVSCKKSPCLDPDIQAIPVKRLIVHEEFNLNTGYADITLLELEYPAILNKWVRTICLSPDVPANIGDYGISAGWGIDNYKNRGMSSGLKELTMEISPKRTCAKYFKKPDFSSRNYICVGGTKGEDTCSGDSGGPFMKIVNLGDVPRMYLLGDLSFGSDECGKGIPSVFTSVVYYLDWVIDNVNSG